MSESLDQATLPLTAENGGRPLGHVRLACTRASAAGTPTLVRLDPREAERWHEEQLQVLEDCRYEYVLEGVPEGCDLRQSDVVTRAVLAADGPRRGLIEPGGNTGLLPIVMEDREGRRVAGGRLEVRSRKVDYRSDYRSMMRDIASRCLLLLGQFTAPAQMRVTTDPRRLASTAMERVALLKSVLESSEFWAGVSTVLSLPITQLVDDAQERPSRRGFRPSSRVLTQVASANPRCRVGSGHPLFARIPTLPTRLVVPANAESRDTAENRFVKYVLTQFDDYLNQVECALGTSLGAAASFARREVTDLRRPLGEALSHDFFRDIGRPSFLPMGSPVLQRRAGYREVLQAWLQFALACSLAWVGGDDVYGMGKKDMAALYEYWCFFELLDIVCNRFSLEEPVASTLLRPTSDGLSLALKRGRTLRVMGGYSDGRRRLRVRFCYNREFRRADYPTAGSWTRSMRPDYTLSLWPAALTADEAEVQEAMVHVHFDAKYRTHSLAELFGADTTDDNDEPEIERAGATPKRVDLLKMHAYRDAVRRSEGAYVLYPGSEVVEWSNYHELLPGLGAFALRPGHPHDRKAIEQFLDAVVDQVCNRASARERERYHTFEAHKSGRADIIAVPLAEVDEDGVRIVPVSERMVLVVPHSAAITLGKPASETGHLCIPLTRADYGSILSRESLGADLILVLADSPAGESVMYRVRDDVVVFVRMADFPGAMASAAEEDALCAKVAVDPAELKAGELDEDALSKARETFPAPTVVPLEALLHSPN